MKKYIFLLSLMILLTSCGGGTSGSFESEKSEIEDSNSNITSSEDSTIEIESEVSSDISSENEESNSESSEIESDSTIEEIVYHQSKISEIREYAKTVDSNPNDVGMQDTSYYVTFKAKLYSTVDAIASSKGYSSRYKALVLDETDYIYVQLDSSGYEYLKKYDNQYGVYEFKGYVTFYNNEIEVGTSGKPTWLESENMTVDFSSITDKTITLEEAYDEIDTLKLNSKGAAYSKIVNLDLLCLATDFENTNVYFTDGTDIVLIHGNDRLYNKFTKGTTYNVYCALSIFYYRPGLEFVEKSLSTKNITFDSNNLETVTASQMSTFSYTKEAVSNPTYTKLFRKAYKFSGYYSYYTEGTEKNMLLVDNYTGYEFTSVATASSAKSVFLKNKNCVGVTTSSEKYCPLFEYEFEQKLDFVVFPYLWNTNKYFQVYYYDVTSNI